MTHPDYESDDYSDFDSRRVLTVPDSVAGQRLDAALAQLLPEFSRSRLAQWVKDGRVSVDGQQVATKHKLWGGETLEVNAEADPETVAFAAEDLPIEVVYEDASLIIINKPAGLVVHPGSGNWSGTLLNALLFHYPELKSIPRAGIVHRLDKDTSGLMVVARTLAAQNSLVQQLQARTVSRHYIAVAQGLLKGDGTVDAPIGRSPRDRVKMAVVHNGKPAVTHYRVLEYFRQHTLVECKLETGRTHQIRVHMAHLGHPLAADSTYNLRPYAAEPEVALALEDLNRQALHARKLALVHPETGKTMSWKAALPDDLEGLLAALRFDAHPDDEGDDWDDDDEDDDHDCEIIYVRD